MGSCGDGSGSDSERGSGISILVSLTSPLCTSVAGMGIGSCGDASGDGGIGSGNPLLVAMTSSSRSAVLTVVAGAVSCGDGGGGGETGVLLDFGLLGSWMGGIGGDFLFLRERLSSTLGVDGQERFRVLAEWTCCT